VLVSESTVEEAGGDFSFERIGEIVVRGRTAPTAVYALAAQG
jgi:class 3 adenylate cyclase